MRRSLFSFGSACAIAGALWIVSVSPSRGNGSAVSAARAASANVELVFREGEADSINFAGGDKRVIVQANPVATTQSSACDGEGTASFPVQNVFVVDKSDTYITDVIVCSSAGLHPGDSWKPTGWPARLRGRVRISFQKEEAAN